MSRGDAADAAALAPSGPSQSSLSQGFARLPLSQVLARDLGDGPHKPFGSALHGLNGTDPLATPPLVGRTMKPRAAGACKLCGDRKYFCDCEDEQ